jgi:hypothetical protein
MERKTRCTVRFETGYYSRNHGAEPRGFGSWAFAEESKAARADGADIFWAHQSTFGAAKKLAAAHFKKLGEARGEANLYVAVLS